MPTPGSKLKSETALFSGGCFWCLDHDFGDHTGVLSVLPGFTPAESAAVPQDIVAMAHLKACGLYRESVLVEFCTKITDYERLLRYFLSRINLNDGNAADSPIAPPFFIRPLLKKKGALRVLDGISGCRTALLSEAPFFAVIERERRYAFKNPEAYQEYLHQSGRTD